MTPITRNPPHSPDAGREPRREVTLTVRPRESEKPPPDHVQSGNSGSPRRGWLRYGNPPGDPSAAPRCGAKTRAGTPCRAPAMWSKRTGKYTRCRLHGGKSTGPRTPEGKERCRMAGWKHGRRSRAEQERRRALRDVIRLLQAENVVLARLVRAVERQRRREREKPRVWALRPAN